MLNAPEKTGGAQIILCAAFAFSFSGYFRQSVGAYRF
jgi:hypothetical protein